MNLDSIDEVLRAKGMKYDFDFCGWYTEGRSLKNGSILRLFIPPFGITDKMLYNRLLSRSSASTRRSVGKGSCTSQ